MSGLQRQVDDKVKESERLAKLDAEYDALWLSDISRKEKRENEEKAYRALQNAENKMALDRQVQAKSAKKAAIRTEEQKSDQLRLLEWEKEKRIAIEKNIANEMAKAGKLKKIQQDNIKRLAEDAKAKEVERARDLFLLQETLKKEKKEIAKEQAQKKMYRDAARDYQEQLKILMQKEVESQDEMNRCQ